MILFDCEGVLVMSYVNCHVQINSFSFYFAALIQLLAAAETGRDVVYFTFNDKELMHEVHRMHSFLVENNKTVGEYFWYWPLKGLLPFYKVMAPC